MNQTSSADISVTFRMCCFKTDTPSGLSRTEDRKLLDRIVDVDA
jgi:hypothetical protein